MCDYHELYHTDCLMESGVTSDELFLERLFKIIEDNLENNQFGVEELARDIGISRTQLHRKLHQINGKSASQVIREYRLEKAKEILEEEDLTAAEVAYKVGFGSSSYFNTCFNEFYGYPPGESRNHSDTKINDQKSPIKRLLILGSGLLLIVFVMVLVWLFRDLIIENSNANKELSPEKITIAVIPFENKSNDPDQEYFNDGVAENIRNKLSRISELRVIPMISTRIYKSQVVNAKQIGKELDADYLLAGSLFKVKNQIRMIVSLIDCKSGLTKWSEPYDREFDDIFKLQSEIAVNVTRELQIKLTNKEYFTLEEIIEINPDVYTDFLFAGFLKEQYEEKNDTSYNYQAIQLLNQIIKSEPLFTEAYVNLAWNLWYTRYYNRQLFESIGTDSIPNLIQKALDRNPEYPDAYYFLSKFYYQHDDFPEAEKNLRKVIELDPNHYNAMFDLADALYQQRNFEEAFKYLFAIIRLKPINIHSSEVDLEQMHLVSVYFFRIFMVHEPELILRKMLELDSVSGCDLNVYNYLANCSRAQGKWNDYFRWVRAQYKCDTTSMHGINVLARAHVFLGHYREGIHYYNLGLEQARIYHDFFVDTTWLFPHRAYAYQQLGDEQKATQILRSFIEWTKNGQYDNMHWKRSNIAEAYALLGEKEKALDLLKTLPYSSSQFIPYNELLYNLKEEKEYQEIVQKVKAEEERLRNIALSPEFQREVRWFLDRLEIDY